MSHSVSWSGPPRRPVGDALHGRPVRLVDRRRQLARAAVAVAATVGFAAMTIDDIAAFAGLARRTFSRHYPDKHAAFEVGYQEITDALRATVQAAYAGAATPAARTRACLQALADFLAEDPARAEALLIHGHAAGPETVEIHRETMRRLVALIMRNTADLPHPGGDARLLAETVAGGIYEVAYARTLRGQVRELPGMVPAWSAVVMAPYAAVARRRAPDAAA